MENDAVNEADFNSIWQELKDKWGDETLQSLLGHSEIKEQARRFYEKVTPKWLKEVPFGSDRLTDKAMTQFIRLRMTYSFIYGYVARVAEEYGE